MTITYLDTTTINAVAGAEAGANGTREAGVITALAGRFGGSPVTVEIFDASDVLLRTSTHAAWTTFTAGAPCSLTLGSETAYTFATGGTPAKLKFKNASGTAIFSCSAGIGAGDIVFQRDIASGSLNLAIVFTSSTALDTADPASLEVIAGLVNTMSPGTWLKINTNAHVDVWPGVSDAASNSTPYGVFTQWSGSAFDTIRGQLYAWGGGHAGYNGNEIYGFNLNDLEWYRGCLPSEMMTVSGTAEFGPYTINIPVDGAINAPSSAHSYGWNAFLPNLNRMLAVGGGIYNSAGGFYEDQGSGTLRPTGPYLMNPALLNADKVGGTDGSGYDGARLGAQIWNNRRAYFNGKTPIPTTSMQQGYTLVRTESFGGTDYDVAYILAPLGGAGALRLYRYRILNIADPSQDEWFACGTPADSTDTYHPWAVIHAPSNKVVCGRVYDALNRLVTWQLPTPGTATPSSPNNVWLTVTDSSAGGAWDQDAEQMGAGYRASDDAIFNVDLNGMVYKIVLDSGATSGTVTSDGTTGTKPVAPGNGWWSHCRYLDAAECLLTIDGVGDVWIYRPAT
jgi:hypothetical protein